MHPKLVHIAAAIALLLLPALSSAAISDRPMHFAVRAFAHNSESVEHVTVRGEVQGHQSSFFRFAIANAGFKKGELTVTFKQRTPKGTIYAKRRFKRGQYQVFSDRFGLQAGGNRLEVVNGNLLMSFNMNGVHAVATVVPHASPLLVKDRDSSGWIRRNLIVPWGTLQLQASNSAGVKIESKGTVFAVHEASNLKAHRSYDRAIQLHMIRGRRLMVVDYIVAPEERRHRPLGFVVLHGGELNYVGPVTIETRGAIRTDRKNDYQVPWIIQVQTKARSQTATVTLNAQRQTSRKDDLAGLGFFARKAVSLLIHPFTYGLYGKIQASVLHAKTQAATELTFQSAYKYAQARE